MAAVSTTDSIKDEPDAERDPAAVPTRGGPSPEDLERAPDVTPEGTRQPQRDATQDYEQMTVEKLTDLADERGVELKSGMRKADIIKALEEAEKPGQGTTQKGKGDLLPVGSPEARRALAEAGFSTRDQTEIARTKEKLDAMPKEDVYIPQSQSKPMGPVSVQINDYTYFIQRGKPVKVPAEVARIAREAGYLDLP
jgi:hypothetical protein